MIKSSLGGISFGPHPTWRRCAYMTPNCKIPSSLFIGNVIRMTLPDIAMLFFYAEVLHQALPGEVFDERIVPFTCKRAIGI